VNVVSANGLIFYCTAKRDIVTVSCLSVRLLSICNADVRRRWVIWKVKILVTANHYWLLGFRSSSGL